MNAPHHPLARIVVDQATGQKYQLIPVNDYDPSPETTSVQDILFLVAKSAGLLVRELKSARLARKYAFPRQVAYWCASQYTMASSAQIGRMIGDRDHTTILLGVKKIDRLLNAPGTTEAVEANRIIHDVQRGLGLVR